MAIATVAAISAIAMGANYDVGGPAGSWDLATNYTQWVSGKAFRVGDTLSESSPSSFPPLYIAYDVQVYDIMHILAEVIKKKDARELIAYECSQVVQFLILACNGNQLSYSSLQLFFP